MPELGFLFLFCLFITTHGVTRATRLDVAVLLLCAQIADSSSRRPEKAGGRVTHAARQSKTQSRGIRAPRVAMISTWNRIQPVSSPWVYGPPRARSLTLYTAPPPVYGRARDQNFFEATDAAEAPRNG